MPADFDPELYLRLIGEQALLESSPTKGHPGPWGRGQLGEVAAALVAVSALAEERAQSIVDDYELALSIRGLSHLPAGFRRPRNSPRPSRLPLKASRVVVCERTLEEAWGELRVHYVALGDRRTTLYMTASLSDASVSGRPSQMPGSFQRFRQGMPVSVPMQHPLHQLRQLSLTDDQGRTEVTQLSGGGGGEEGFRGHLTTTQPLARETKWLDIGANRVDLVGDSDPPRVDIETLPDSDPAERYLWGRLTAGRHGPHGGNPSFGIEDSIETLLVAGALAPDNPVIDQVRAVFEGFSGQQPKSSIPQPWRALLAGISRQGGGSEVIALGVVTPPFDDTVISFDALVITEGAFELHLSTSPNPGAPWGPMSPSMTGSTITWWAEDDVGNAYLGATSNWGGGVDLAEGTVTYWPALDRRATQLRLMPTGASERAVVTVELARSEDAELARSEDAELARSEDAELARSEDAELARSEDAE
jgi:hypothetical protein